MILLASVALCLVVGVADGDTITVRCGDSPQQRVRLTEIDAPEKGQAFGQRAKQVLSGLVYDRQVELVSRGTDRYRRPLVVLMLDGRNINLEMVRQGMAWCYIEYLTDESCLGLQEKAQSARVGLWRDPDPQPPWEWRKARRKH
jgi:micrococcal nuclease